jgi:DNA-binding NarL/FixJ family response regulator
VKSGGGRVLIADGDAASRTLTANVLEDGGYETAQAATGSEALETVRTDSIGLVLLDLSLPDMTGYEVCLALREQRGEELPIFLLSSDRNEPQDRVAGLLLGADDFIARPYDPSELRARVYRFLVRKRPEEAPAWLQTEQSITPREQEVLQLLVEGRSQKIIAQRLSISGKTVGTHIQHLLQKTGAHSRAELIARAYQDGMVEPVVPAEARS